MATVYERICHFEAQHWFRFKPIGKRQVGSKVLKEWNKVGFGKDDELSVVDSIEPEGQFRVLNFPDYFTSTIDSIISDHALKIIEKPASSLPKPAPLEPQKRKRKRIPLRKPAFSGSLINNSNNI